MRFLLVTSCSGKKNEATGKLPALERYTGFPYDIIHKLEREHHFPKSVDVVIISAKYGLLKASDLIDDYEQRMTRERARELNPQVHDSLRDFLHGCEYAEVLVNLGKDYLPAFEGFERFFPNTKIVIAEGGIGQKKAQIKTWLESKR